MERSRRYEFSTALLYINIDQFANINDHHGELAGDDRSYEAIIDGTAYNVVERVYALYPQESGSIEISPARFEARVLRNGRITGRKVFESEPLSVTILPIPDRPGLGVDLVE